MTMPLLRGALLLLLVSFGLPAARAEPPKQEDRGPNLASLCCTLSGRVVNVRADAVGPHLAHGDELLWVIEGGWEAGQPCP